MTHPELSKQKAILRACLQDLQPFSTSTERADSESGTVTESAPERTDYQLFQQLTFTKYINLLAAVSHMRVAPSV